MLCECKHCHKSFQSNVKTMTCKDCKKIDEEIYEKIRDYLERYPNSNALNIAEALKLKASLVLKYVDEGRLVVKTGKFEKL